MDTTKSKIHAALAAADIPKLIKNKTAVVPTKKGAYTYKYASLDDIMCKIRKPLSDQGLTITHDLREQHTQCYTILTHSESGEHIETPYPTLITQGDSHQTLGAKMTYARRYGLCLLLGLAPDEDLDGNMIEDNTNYQHKATAPNPDDIAKLKSCQTLEDLAAMWEKGFSKQQRQSLAAVKNEVKEALLDKGWDEGTLPTGPEKEETNATEHA